MEESKYDSVPQRPTTTTTGITGSTSTTATSTSPSKSNMTLIGGAGATLVGILGITIMAARAFLPFWAFLSLITLIGIGLGVGVWVLSKRIQYLSATEQLLVNTLTDRITIVGPCVYFPSYLNVLSFKKRKATPLSALEYVVVKTTTTGALSTVRGPTALLLGAHDVVHSGPSQGLALTDTMGVIVSNSEDGSRRLVKGPTVFVPTPFEKVTKPSNALVLQRDQFVKVENTRTGEIAVEQGERIMWLSPHENMLGGGVKRAFSLKAHQYVKLRNSGGTVRVVRGEALVIPAAHEEALDGGVQDAIDLKAWEYCHIQDRTTGEIRCERGEKLLWLDASDCMVLGKQQAVTVDTQHAALVRNKNSGVQRLVSEPQLFVPTADEEVMEVRDLIRLAEHEAVVLKDAEGNYDIRFGDPAKGTERAFFLPPYTELVTMCWSRGRRRERRDLMITVFDTRPQYMSFEFNCRTSDNVEMVLEGTFFWEVSDIEAMLKFTGDASGDVCAHARSCFIQLISKVTLAQFMDSFNVIAKEAHQADDGFYARRGIKIHSLEVTRYQCADKSTASILQAIIAETTNRMNRLSCMESENEVQLAKLHGALEQENAKSEVLQIQQQHAVESARAEGLAEAERVTAFLQHMMKGHGVGVGDGDGEAASEAGSEVLVDGGAGGGAEAHGFSAKLAEELWHTLRKGENVANVAKGSAHVYFTPEGANLTIENKQ